MKRIFFTAIISALSLGSFAQGSSFKVKIDKIENADIQVMILPLKLGEIPILDNIKCVNSKFEYNINFNLNMWHLVRLRSPEFNAEFGEEKSGIQKLKNREMTFFVYPNDQISIIAEIAEFGINYQVYGNDINIQRNQFAEILFPIEEEFNRLSILYKKNNPDDEESRKLENQIASINRKIDSIRLKSIIEHPDWIYSAESIARFAEDTIAKYFKSFTSNVQNSFFGIHLSKILNAAEIGSPAPEFSLRNDKDEYVQLSNFKGKFVVLEFWGTWCGYCTKGIPKMKEYQSKYQHEVEFISIACRDNKETWLEALAKYNMNWINLFAENEDITDKYGVQGYPTKMIIDKDGKIVLKTTGESDEFYDKIDEILNINNR